MTPMNSRSFVVGALMMLLLPTLSGSAAPSVEELVDRLQSATNSLQTLQAEFTQSLHTMSFGAPQQESGTLYLKRPMLMRWEYDEPEEKLALVDGQRSWLYVPAEGQVFVGDLAEAERGGIAALLLAGELDLRRDFEVTLLLDEGGRPVSNSLSLTPRQPGEEFERIDLTVSARGLPSLLVVHGALGDVMEYRLSKVRTGLSLDPALFRFVPPEGVEVVPVQ